MSEIRQLNVAPTGTQERAGTDVVDRHRHDDHQLVYVSSGVVAIRTERGAWVASNDRALWIPAGVWHEHRFYGATTFHTVGFRTRRAPLVSADEPVVVGIDPLARELIIALTDLATTPRQKHPIEAVLRDRIRQTTVRPITLPAPSDPRLAEACRAVEDDLRRRYDLADLARLVGTSERTLSRLFRTELAMTYPQWRTRTRIFAAMVSLAEGATVTRTAYACGWATPSAFIDSFGRAMGTTPGDYRRTAVAGSRPTPTTSRSGAGRGCPCERRATGRSSS
jgi:AraC-like DNA-binding protein